MNNKSKKKRVSSAPRLPSSFAVPKVSAPAPTAGLDALVGPPAAQRPVSLVPTPAESVAEPPQVVQETAPTPEAEPVSASPASPTASAPPSSGEGRFSFPTPRDRGPKWHEQHKRVTFYCPNELADELEAVVKSTGVSKTTLINEALRYCIAQHTKS